MILIATSKHGYRKEGERFACDEPLASLLLSKGSAVAEGQGEPKEVKQVKTKKK